MQILLSMLVVTAVIVMLAWPVLQRTADAVEDADRAALEAAKQSKYREIRDCELDYKAGKLDLSEWQALDNELRAEALTILRKLDDATAANRGSPVV